MELLFTLALACIVLSFLQLKTSKKLTAKNDELVELQKQFALLSAKLDTEKKHAQEKIAFLEHAQEAMSTTFKAISADTLKSTQTSFFEVAKQTFEKYHQGMQSELNHKHLIMQELVKPLRESLEKVDSKIQDIEKTRVSAYTGVTEQLRLLALSQTDLQKETQKLVKALHTPSARGKWGELQLKRVVEMAGMVEYCDFVTQVTIEAETRIRPDMVIRLPNSRSIVIDAKAPLQAYLEAIEIQDEEGKVQKLKEHAKQLRKHLTDLSDKSYWDHLHPTPEFVILFLPGESFFSAALECDPTLVELGVEKKVLLATPTTLIALLKTVAYGWKERKLTENAEAISELGKLLYERLSSMIEHFIRLKRSLDSSTEAYNKMVGSFEARVLVTARKFHDLGGGGIEEIPPLEPVEKLCRALTSTEGEGGDKE